jgi:protein-S-isoprenylcysteine O-methyltransferase Ste14
MRYIFEITWICWFLSEILLNRLLHSKSINSKNWDKSSLRLIWITIIVSISLGITSKINLLCPIIKSEFLPYIGLLLIITGIIIRFISIRTLGKFFTVDLAINNDHKLITKGLYKTIRHPSYAGSLLSFLGLGLSFNNWVSLAVIFLRVLTAFITRINIEEKLMLEQEGLEYDNYKKHTKRLVPMIY